MTFAGCAKVANKKGEVTRINHIINGRKSNDAWTAFCVSLTTTKKEMKRKAIDELEEMMLENENTRKEDEDKI